MPLGLIPPLLVGIAVSTSTAAATLLTTQGHSVFAGQASVSACSLHAHVDVSTSYSELVPGYQLSRLYLQTSPACASDTYQLTVVSATGTSLAQIVGRLDASGSGTQDISTRHVPVEAVGSYSAVVSG